MSTVLITGASGFLGSHYLDWFVRHSEQDWDVWPMDIKPHPLGIPYDLMDLERWLEDFDVPCDLVIHMAAPVGGREKIEGDPLYNADSLRLDSALFRWAVKHAKTVVYPSSSAVYGVRLQEGEGMPLAEPLADIRQDTWLAPDEMYGFTKLAGERLAWSAAKYGLNTLCLRPFSGYGEGQSFEYPVPSIARRALHQEDPLTVWGSGDQRRDFIYVTDIINATMARLDDGPVNGMDVLNIGSGRAVSFNEIARMCAEIISRGPNTNVQSRGYDPVIENLMDKPVGVSSRYCDPRKLNQFYKPEVPLTEGLARVIEFIRSSEETDSAQNVPSS